MAARARHVHTASSSSRPLPADDLRALSRFGGVAGVVWAGALASFVLHVALGVVVATIDTQRVTDLDLPLPPPPPIEAELPTLVAWTPDEVEEEDVVEDVDAPETPEPVEEPEPEPEPEPEVVAQATHNDVEPEPEPEREPVQRRERVAKPEPEPVPEPDTETEALTAEADAATTAYAEAMATDASNDEGVTAPPQSAPRAAPAAATGARPDAAPVAPSDDARSTVGSGTVDRGVVEKTTAVDVAGLQKDWLRTVDGALHKDYPYPRIARRRGLEGRVKLKIWIAADGSITKAKVHRSSGHDSLDEAALEAVLGLASVPVPPREIGWRTRALIVPFDYRLDG